jgi:hypothetical protein
MARGLAMMFRTIAAAAMACMKGQQEQAAE